MDDVSKPRRRSAGIAESATIREHNVIVTICDSLIVL
jgi:hypothetical protein